MIGVFDSGYGGLTVHRALAKAFPETDFIYLGDTGNAPYGTRTSLDVLTLACVGVDRLFEAGCSLVIIVCNTASTVALRWIQQMWLPSQTRRDGKPRNVLGIVVPTVEAALQSSPDAVSIFATDRTVQSTTYPAELHLRQDRRQPNLPVYQKACSGLVALIESGANRDALRACVHRYVGELLQKMDGIVPDRAILGCTQYAAVADLFAEALPPATHLIDQPAATAQALADYLQRHPEFALHGKGQRMFWTTGDLADAPRLSQLFYGASVVFERI